MAKLFRFIFILYLFSQNMTYWTFGRMLWRCIRLILIRFDRFDGHFLSILILTLRILIWSFYGNNCEFIRVTSNVTILSLLCFGWFFFLVFQFTIKVNTVYGYCCSYRDEIEMKFSSFWLKSFVWSVRYWILVISSKLFCTIFGKTKHQINYTLHVWISM